MSMGILVSPALIWLLGVYYYHGEELEEDFVSMQAKRRYILAAGSSVLLVLCYINFKFSQSDPESDEGGSPRRRLRGYLSAGDLGSPAAADYGSVEADPHFSPKQRRENNGYRSCRMETCFDFTKCQDGFKVYVYPNTQDQMSSRYSEILTALRQSRYATNDPLEACLFVPSIDTLDRDKLSVEYIQNLDSKIQNLEYWNGGLNHIIFNLYPGTWPDYDETHLNFNPGKAILARASVSDTYFRPNFDISFPLFHKEHSFKGGEPGYLTDNFVPPTRKYALSFKGKRYLTGIGSETRNSLYHIHNDEDIIMLTTCKHGKSWKDLKDDRCERDNAEYEKYDYKILLHNSTFCLVPRGRRLASYRFLEALQAACIPVFLSNNWVLPFSEVIDWNKAAVWGDERLLLQIPSIVRSIRHADLLALRQQTQFLWDTYFSSIDKIVATTLEIIKGRVFPEPSHSLRVWNSQPGALAVLPEYSQSLTAYPFYWNQMGMPSAAQRFTAVIYATSTSVMVSSPLYRLVKSVSKSSNLHKILILWSSSGSLPKDVRWPARSDIQVILKPIRSINERFLPFEEIETDAVLNLDEDATLVTDEMDFAFHVWQNFEDRIVGYPARGHYWDETNFQWAYSSKWTNDYSLVLTGAAFYHRYYGYLYTHWLGSSLHQLVDNLQNCEDILFNLLVSHFTHKPPIKVGQRHYYKEAVTAERVSHWHELDHFLQRHYCMHYFADSFGYMPLKRSTVRIDPLLFKDQVSILRKKYRQMETIS